MKMDNSVFYALRRIVICTAMALFAAGTWAQEVPQDLLDAAKAGDAQAQATLGDCYLDGNGVTQDYAKAVEWFTMAAEQGYSASEIACTENDFNYKLSSDGNGVTITGVKSKERLVVAFISDTIEDMPVTEIGDKVFERFELLWR